MRLTPGISIALIAYNKLLEQFETSKRGGYTFVETGRYVKANDKCLDDYDENINQMIHYM